MTRQDDPRLESRPQIEPTGCAFMCGCWYANKFNNAAMDPQSVMRWYDHLTAFESDVMTVRCFIRDWRKLLVALGVDCEHVRHEPKGYQCEFDEFEILQWERPRPETNGVWRHFTAGDGLSHCTYDPLGESNTVAQGDVVQKVVFRRIL